MAIDFDTVEAQLGHLFGILYQTHTFTSAEQSGLLPTLFDLASEELGTNYDIAALLPAAEEAARAGVVNALIPNVKAAAVAILNRSVIEDTKLPSNSDLSITMLEFIRQMSAGSKSVAKCTVSGSASAWSGNSGTGSVVISVLRPDGLSQANMFTESGVLKCNADSQTGGATLGRETFVYQGNPAVDPFSDKWPAGSGATVTMNSIDSKESANSTGNILNNSSFDTLNDAADGWTGWKIGTGTYNTNLTTDAVNVFRSTKSLKIVGGATLTEVYQNFGDSTYGTSVSLKPLTEYAIVVRHMVDVVPAAGVLTINLADQANNAIADAQSTANSKTVTLSSLTTTFNATTMTFRTPAATPTTGYRLRVRISTGLSSGSNLFIDDIAMAEMKSLYKGGPLVSVFSGAAKWIHGDYFNCAMANNRASANLGATFQAMFDRFFDMREKALLLPESATPTFDDASISATS